MDLRLFTEPQQGGTYDDQLALARTAQDCGFDAFFRSDHYLAMDTPPGDGPTDSWITLAGLARDTDTIRLGTLVTSNTFRHPGVLAISVAQVDRMSAGRVELGLGAGWFEAEHRAYGIPFPPVGERFDALEDALAVITGLWDAPPGGTFTHRGPTTTVEDSPGLPKPVQQPRPPLIIGGRGKRRTPALAARYADEFNLPFVGTDEAVTLFTRVEDACRTIGRDPASIVRSVALAAVVGRTDQEVARRADAIGREVEELKANALCGSPAEVVDRLGQWRNQAGVDRVYLQLIDQRDLAHAELIGGEVLPEV